MSDDIGHLLDRDAEIDVAEHCLPHWMQDGAIAFITIRLADSLPEEVLARWDRERMEFLQRKGIGCDDWRLGQDRLSKSDKTDFDKQFRWLKEIELDQCHGKCQLADPDAAQIVAKSLLHFDDDRYLMGDFVIMPNHVHMLAVFPKGTELRKQCYSWMHYTAVQINRLNGDSGTLWQDEPFDHLVRSEKQLCYLRDYIKDNPGKVNLPEGQYLYRRSSRAY